MCPFNGWIPSIWKAYILSWCIVRSIWKLITPIQKTTFVCCSCCYRSYAAAMKRRFLYGHLSMSKTITHKWIKDTCCSNRFHHNLCIQVCILIGIRNDGLLDDLHDGLTSVHRIKHQLYSICLHPYRFFSIPFFSSSHSKNCKHAYWMTRKLKMEEKEVGWRNCCIFFLEHFVWALNFIENFFQT